MPGGLTPEEKALIAAATSRAAAPGSGHVEVAPAEASAHSDGVYNGHPAPEPSPTPNTPTSLQSNASLRDELLGGAHVTGSQGVE